MYLEKRIGKMESHIEYIRHLIKDVRDEQESLKGERNAEQEEETESDDSKDEDYDTEEEQENNEEEEEDEKEKEKKE